MKTSGPIMPESGWFHRASTSNPTISPVAKIDLRFEIGNELAVLEAVADALLDLAVGDQRAFHAGVEPDGARDPAAARMVHRNVGAAKQVGNARFGRRAPTAMPAKAPTWMIRSSNSSGASDGAEHGIGELLGAADIARRSAQARRRIRRR